MYTYSSHALEKMGKDRITKEEVDSVVFGNQTEWLPDSHPGRSEARGWTNTGKAIRVFVETQAEEVVSVSIWENPSVIPSTRKDDRQRRYDRRKRKQ